MGKGHHTWLVSVNIDHDAVTVAVPRWRGSGSQAESAQPASTTLFCVWDHSRPGHPSRHNHVPKFIEERLGGTTLTHDIDIVTAWWFTTVTHGFLIPLRPSTTWILHYYFCVCDHSSLLWHNHSETAPSHSERLSSYSPRLILGLKIRTTCQVVQWYWKKPSSQLCVSFICRNLSTPKPGLSLPADDPWKHLTKKRGERPSRPKRGRNIFKLNLPRDLQMIWNSSRSGKDGSLQTPCPQMNDSFKLYIKVIFRIDICFEFHSCSFIRHSPW